MEFRIRERESDEEVEWIAKWPFPARSQFIRSRTYDILIREMQRYIIGEVPGRSFLISGHRGSGKTSLVRLAADELNRDILKGAGERAKREKSTEDLHERGRALNLQRPLLVKLHGPSLLAPAKKPPPKPDESKAAASKPSEGAAAKSDPQAAAANAGIAFTAPKPEAEAPADTTAFALEQITTALYRALTMEFARSFTNHTYEKLAGTDAGRGTEDLELAGQFALDLDNAPRVGLLRSYYARLGRIDSGVLWPRQITDVLFSPGKSDQGIREMIALATAAQAFEVCSGDITDKQTRKDTLSRDETAETKVEAGLKDVANKLLGLAAGVLVGFGSASALGWTGGAAAGVATGLLSTLTLGWTSKRSRKDERVLDYTFIRRRDRATLERDLPLVIQRVREAGLAPIFVVDELDKLRELDKVKDPRKSIADLINGLKHLTTDYGFFCFLTDRDYFDYVARKVSKEAFPVEHSFFSHRMFILHQPRQLLEYLGTITTVDGGSGSGVPTTSPASDRVAEEDEARSSFGLLMLHRSKLNLIEILRKIAEECDSSGRVRSDSAKLRFDRGYQFQASVQLAVGLLLRWPAIRERVENEARFMQRAIDALYMLSRAWEDEEPTVRLDRIAIVNCLLERSGKVDIDEPATKGQVTPAASTTKNKSAAAGKGKGATQNAAQPSPDPAAEAKAEADLLQTGMSLRDLELVDEAVALLADLLTDANRLKQWLTGQLEPGPEQAAFARIFPPGNLVVCLNPNLRLYKFLFDVYGQDLETRAALQAAQAPVQPVPAAAPAPAGAETGTAPESAEQRAVVPSAPVSAEPGPSTVPTLPETIIQQIRTALDFVANLESALTAAGTNTNELVRAQIFPPVDTAEVERAASRLHEAADAKRPYDGLLKDLPLLQTLAAFMTENGAALTELSRLLLSVAASPGDRVLLVSEAVAAVARYIDLRAAFMATAAGNRPWHAIIRLPFSFDEIAVVPTGDPASLLAWRDQFLHWRKLPLASRFNPPAAFIAWKSAADSVCAYLDKGVPRLEPLCYEYILAAAAKEAPGDVLRQDLRLMTAVDWSRLCLEGFPAKGRDGPFWAFIAGLRALGFARRVLEAAAEFSHASVSTPRRDLIRRLVNSASDAATPGYVLIMRDDGLSVTETVDFLRQNLAQKTIVPALVLPEAGLNDYNEALDWLAANGAVTRLIYEEED
jgi:hypothetical protein